MTQHTHLLVDLIRYVRGLQPGAIQATHIEPSDMLVDQETEQRLPGVKLMPSPDVWLVVKRLDEIPGPTLPEEITPYLTGATNDPQHSPQTVARFEQEQTEANAAGPEAAEKWIQDQWHPWARKAAPILQSNAFYQDLFHAMTRLKLEGGAESREVVCGMGMGAWLTPAGEKIVLPMLVQSCEVVMSADGEGMLEIRPAAAAPELALETFSRGNPATAGLAKGWLDVSQWQQTEYNPGDRSTWGPLLQGLAGRLDPGATMVAQAAPAENLQFDTRWCFYLRDRPSDRVRRDLDALETQLGLKQDEDLPVFLKAMVDKSIHCGTDAAPTAWRGSEHIGKIDPDSQARDLLFPLPYNDEQAQIIGHLDSGCGAIVQGPPGTGKSHTIANVICHYLAHGKSVLVAASAADALDVVREKIPEQVRDLVAALLSSDAQSLADFERSIMEIEHRLANLDVEGSRDRTQQMQSLIDAIHADIARIDQDIEDQTSRHREGVMVGGEQLPLGKVARRWIDGANEGLQPLPGPVPEAIDPEMEHIVARATGLRHVLGPMVDDPHVCGGLPEALPDRSLAAEAFDAQRALDDIKQRLDDGLIWAVGLEDMDQLAACMLAIAELEAQIKAMTDENDAFVDRGGAKWKDTLDRVGGFPDEDPIIERLAKIGLGAARTSDKLRQTDGRVNASGWLGRDEHVLLARNALEQLAQGGKGLSWMQRMMHAKAQAMLDQVVVDGHPPKSASEWAVVKDRVDSQVAARSLYVQWNGIAKELDLAHISDKGSSISGVMQSLARAWRACEHARKITHAWRAVQEYSRQVFVQGAYTPPANMQDIERARNSIDGHIQARGLQKTLDAWIAAVEQTAMSGPFGQHAARDCRDLATRQDVLNHWESMEGQLEALRDMAGKRQALQVAIDQASALGFGAWAGTWSRRDGEVDALWKQRWAWQQMEAAIKNAGNPGQMEILLQQRREKVQQLTRTIGELAAIQSWVKASENASPEIRRALKEYAGAVRKQGAGRGKRAARHMAMAREAMKLAYAAVPCWIMPHGRVSESLPAEIGLFDLVVIDEASQSDIQALPTLLRGKQLLIVGDDRQVSPAAVGVSEERVAHWKANDLARQPYADHMLPEKSLYDLFNVIFSGHDVMLREHFRSVEPIISYSNRTYYHDKIVPLRVPSSAERIDPPLVDVVVRDGVYLNGVNLGEARWIADEIQALLADPSMDGKSIGVVTLTSNDKQSIAIHDELGRRAIDMDTWVRRGLAVGPPPRFQGKERDIMFVSMVWDGRNRREGASNSQSFRQSFNVAMSRARDRIYLVRSNEGRPFRPDSILGGVVGHLQPSSHTKTRAWDGNTTDFPGVVASQLQQLGYRVSREMAPDGVDLVVEDANGHRVAIACDGHLDSGMSPPWHQSMRRQRVLERAGWSIARVFEAHMVIDREGFMARLVDVLDGAGVRADSQDQTAERTVVETRWVGEPVDLQVDAGQPGEEDEGDWPKDPADWPQGREHLLEMGDSPFEKEVMIALLDRGYRIQPQYRCGGYRIDLVVQDRDGARMAIECDGDSHHGLDKMEADRSRQAWLEQVEGLAFWRCWYSDWQADRQGRLDSLWRALEGAGVQPWK